MGKNRILNKTYDTKKRMFSYWHQIDEVRAATPESVLEVGVGSRFVSNYLRNFYSVVTIDVQSDFLPNVIGSVLSLPIKDKSVDVVLCCQVLEHLPFDRFEDALRELARVSSKRIIISLPDKKVFYPIMLPFVGKRKIRKPFQKMPKHVFDGEHHWELHSNDITVDSIISIARHNNLKVIKEYQVFENYKHRFIILEH